MRFFNNRKMVIVFIVATMTACEKKEDNPPLIPSVGNLDVSNYEPTLKDKIKFLNDIKNDLVFVESGYYLMGDIGGGEYDDYHILYASENSKPKHKVTLSGFYISKYKINNEEFNYYLIDQKIKLDYKLSPYRLKQWKISNAMPNLPAHIYWQEAYDYCQWLGKETGLAFSLPTEAQWEYVARNAGKHDGGNYSSMAKNKDKKAYAEQNNTGLGYDQALPRDFYLPNMIGVYDLLNNGFEWMQDWFDYNYYANSPELNPKGPEEPLLREEGNTLRTWNLKSVRGGLAGGVIDSTISRFGFPLEYAAELVNLTARCVVNQERIDND